MILGHSTLENEPESELVTSCGLFRCLRWMQGRHTEDKSDLWAHVQPMEPLAFFVLLKASVLDESPLGRLHCLFNGRARR